MKNKILDAIEPLFKEIHPQNIYAHQIKINKNWLHCQDKSYNLDSFNKIYLLAMGKGSYDEAKFMSGLFESSSYQLEDYLIIAKENYPPKNARLEYFESTHPLVSEKSLKAGERALKFVERINQNDLLLFCLSGGASALVEKYIPGIDLDQAKKLNQILLKSAISIEDFNLIRKSLSQIKNGGLVRNYKGQLLSFISCDIPSSDLFSVSSAPSLYQKLNETKLTALLEQYTHSELKELILKQRKKQIAYPKLKHDYFKMADAITLGQVAKEKLLSCSLKVHLDPHIYNDHLNDKIPSIIKNLQKNKNKANLSLGELQINVTGPGLGGRNTHFVAVMARELFYINKLNLSEKELKQLFILSLATDGSDGPTDATGAYFSHEQFKKCSLQLLEKTIDECDSYRLFEKLNCLLKTGPSGTNLMDLRIICLPTV